MHGRGTVTTRSRHAVASLSQRRASFLRELLDLAQDASSYLRHHPDRAVRVSAALLVAASLAACTEEAPEAAPEAEVLTVPVEPLAQETRRGLPTQPGRYPLVRESLMRDAQGVYHFAWRDPGAAGSPPRYASTSLARLAQAEADELEIPVQGDPILHLRGEEPIPLVTSTSQLVAPTPQSGQTTSLVRSYWYPFYVGGGSYREPAYYDPPRTVPSTGEVRGGQRSIAPQPIAQRAVGLPGAGRAGGTGAGTPASLKSGAGVSSAGGGASAAKSSSFSGGKSSVSGGSSSS